MIDIPFDEAIQKIVADSGISQQEVENKVKAKLEELSGLISKDGAVHIIANELGVQLTRPATPGKETKIADLSPASRSVTVKGRVVRKWEVREFERNGRKGKVANLLIGDETGVTKLVFWNDQVDTFEQLKENDVLVVRNPFVKEGWQGRLELQLNDQSAIDVNPSGVSVEAPQRPQQAEREQKYIKDLTGSEQNVEIIATIVQIYDPRFYDACGQCRRKLSPEGLCPEHGEVEKDVNFNLAAFLDDGTGNVRTSFWKSQALQLTGKSVQDFLKFRDEPTSFEETKNELLGEIIKVVGNVKKNDTFDRLELNAQLVFKDVDPAKEIANLEKKFSASRDKDKVLTVSDDEAVSLDDLDEA